MPKPQHITPKCCQDVQKYATIFLVVPESFYDGDIETPPKWRVMGWSERLQCTASQDAQFCPHCGTAVPEVEPSDVKRKICRVTDGGYYCDTCTKRLSSCQCLMPEFRWKPKL